LDANASFFMLLGGVLISYIEFVRPGWVVPGVVGGITAMVGLARLAELGMDAWALLTLLIGATLLVAEAMLWKRRFLLLYGVALGWAISMMAWGGSHLVQGMDERKVVLAVIPFALITTFLLRTAMRARRNKLRAS
jgi:membrane-bound serine protease (ClpP class)